MTSKTLPFIPADYAALLSDIKQRVRHGQTRAMLAVNAELIRLYWDIGALIHARQQQEGWGAGVIPRLARDLHNELPEEKGFSERNIKRMLAFYREYPHLQFVPQAVAQMEPDPKVPQAAALFPVDLVQPIPWGHHTELMAKVKDLAAPFGLHRCQRAGRRAFKNDNTWAACPRMSLPDKTLCQQAQSRS